MEKKYFGGLDLLRPDVIEATKMPRTAAIPVVRDPRTSYLNAGTYSAGVTSIKPLHVLFGPKGSDAIDAFRESGEFCVAVPRREQIDHMWVSALEIPHGISEIDVVGWHELASRQIATPGIAECPLNLECRTIFCRPLPPPWRTIVIGEVVGVSLDTSLLSLTRDQVLRLYPMHEAGSHPQTGLYAPSVFAGETSPSTPAPSPAQATGSADKTYVAGADLYKPENDAVLMNAIWPRPTYILLTSDGWGHVHALPISGGALQSTEPAVQIPIPRDSDCYRDIRDSGEFAVAAPDRSLIAHVERLEQSTSHDLAGAGFTLLRPNMVRTPGLRECRVNMDCKVVMLEDVPGTDYAMMVGRRIGVTLDEDVHAHLDPAQHTLADRLSFVNELYASFMYAVMDRGMARTWRFHDKTGLSVRPLPSWGSRYSGGWWGPGPALNYWLIELCQSDLLTKPDYYKILHWLRLWNNGRLIPQFAEFIDDTMRNELRQRLTTLMHMMAWAHRDLEQWRAVRAYLAQFPQPPRDHHSGPVFHERWSDQEM